MRFMRGKLTGTLLWTNIAVLMTASLVANGCGENTGITEPQQTVYTLDSPPPFVRIGERTSGLSFEDAEDKPEWHKVAEDEVEQGEMKTVGGSHYELLFYRESLLRKKITATIEEYDGHVIDFQLGPHGEVFGAPVRLQISYSGTDADPDMPFYRPGALQFFWLDPETNIWVPLPGEDNANQKTYRVSLPHFSHYALAILDGKAGW